MPVLLRTTSRQQTYKGYFGEAYAGHKASIAAVGKALQTAFSEAAVLTTDQAYRTLAEDAQFWGAYCEHKFIPPEAASRILVEMKELHEAAIELLEAKLAAPLDAILPSAAFIAAEANWAATIAELEASHEGLGFANIQIGQVKSGNAAADKATVEANLSALRLGQKRHAEPIASLAQNYRKLQDQKKKFGS